MNSKGKFFIFGLILLLFLSVSAVSASENQTVLDDSSGNVETADDDEYYDSYIIADDIDEKYSPNNVFNVLLLDEYGDDIYGENLKLVWSDGIEESLYEWDDEYGYNTFIDKGVGNYSAYVVLKNSYYNAEPVKVNIKISKATVKLSAKEWYTTTGQYATLKVTVKDHNNNLVDDGVVRFKVNGKSYEVDVFDGVASKKIKLSKAKTYTYSATFYGDNYKNKTVKSKIHVLATTKAARTFNMKGYKVTLTQSQFKKLVDAKNTNKRVSFEVKSNKYVTQKVSFYKTTYSWKYKGIVSPETAHERGWLCKEYVKHWVSDGEYYYTCKAYEKVYNTQVYYKNVKARVSLLFSYGGKTGGQYVPANKYCIYLTTPYQNPGYDYCKPWVKGVRISSQLNTIKSTKLLNPNDVRW